MPLSRTARRTLTVGAALLAIAATAAGAAPARADAAPQPQCGEPAGRDFPITSRLTGGPEAYERGGAPRDWRLELRNDTGAACRAIHPVAVLADRARALQPAHVHVDFYDPDAGRWRPVSLERTDEAENVGVLDGRAPGFAGFTVPAHGTVTVRMRVGFARNAPEGPVTANVTAVQRRGRDGAWVGESEDYHFDVGGGAAPAPAPVRSAEHPRRMAPVGAPALADTGALPAVVAVSGALLAAGTALLLGAWRLRRAYRGG
ncbi:hypothetical protein AB0K09_21440 [Streptomyces sp. NPDC049577]|uniref:hypothetical protein n=1 Tax=Streptomyces sp. NPDC049577 TaxID=3155153 RepID=UPI003414DF09